MSGKSPLGRIITLIQRRQSVSLKTRLRKHIRCYSLLPSQERLAEQGLSICQVSLIHVSYVEILSRDTSLPRDSK